MKVYTKTGDQGKTGLLTGERVDKDSLRVEAYGSVDEITSALGLARATCRNRQVCETVYELQKLLMLVMADLASTGETAYITAEKIARLEEIIDRFDGQLPPLTHFIIPGGTTGAAALDLARTTTRRAERNVLRLAKEEAVNTSLAIVLNRLSDLCFVLARAEAELPG
ncbi:cob(I)yrinic acid a,c-diamide adenosyltransferase [Propionispora hippei]|uniref:Corrinoid adenosyltransferase n=1 Tax=Propionispora hippei DSM 15287 TaxID=1123003 RepID=A0A1M6CS67_9FIRM|nr:cob(I)yrinic acid a,c-diamide adenosyltransferase [Propionispora hippei]SHI63634.1 cob(I)alamin adenosyltransferase [Propionispora hippei DSM 15287]